MRHHQNINKSSALYSIAIVGFFASLHMSLPTYFNSSFLGIFVNEKTVGLIYLSISIITILGFLSMNTILPKIGNLRTSLLLIIIQIAVFYGIITSSSASSLIPLFILGMSIINMIALTFDIFLQKNTSIGHTGSVRGIYMTSINVAWVLGPMLGGMLIVGNNYNGVYIAAFALLFPLLYLVYKNFSNFHDAHYVKISTRDAFIKIIRNNNISKIFFINIVLQTFYAWMVVYTPIYLHTVIGFNWQEISFMFTIMLIPFILIEIPLGKLADRKWGEKEMMAMGFVIMSLSTLALALFTVKSVIIWTIMLFITRIGAATAEIMIETYFFKKVDGHDPEILSMFRITRPASYFIAPLITAIGLMYTTDRYLFVILGMICLITLYPILKIRDTN